MRKIHANVIFPTHFCCFFSQHIEGDKKKPLTDGLKKFQFSKELF